MSPDRAASPAEIDDVLDRLEVWHSTGRGAAGSERPGHSGEDRTDRP